MEPKIHFSIASQDITASITDYSKRFGQAPDVVVDNEYALWKTSIMNFSVRYDSALQVGELRHLGWEDADATEFSKETDVNGIIWERFNEQQQNDEIKAVWPHVLKTNTI